MSSLHHCVCVNSPSIHINGPCCVQTGNKPKNIALKTMSTRDNKSVSMVKPSWQQINSDKNSAKLFIFEINTKIFDIKALEMWGVISLGQVRQLDFGWSKIESTAVGQNHQFWLRHKRLCGVIDHSCIPTNNGTKSRSGWTKIQQMYENVHPNLAPVPLFKRTDVKCGKGLLFLSSRCCHKDRQQILLSASL